MAQTPSRIAPSARERLCCSFSCRSSSCLCCLSPTPQAQAPWTSSESSGTNEYPIDCWKRWNLSHKYPLNQWSLGHSQRVLWMLAMAASTALVASQDMIRAVRCEVAHGLTKFQVLRWHSVNYRHHLSKNNSVPEKTKIMLNILRLEIMRKQLKKNRLKRYTQQLESFFTFHTCLHCVAEAHVCQIQTHIISRGQSYNHVMMFRVKPNIIRSCTVM